MNAAEVKELLEQAISLQECHVEAEGTHFKVIAVGDLFEGMSRVKAQQTIYQPLSDVIADGSVHAVTIKTFTPEKWQRERKLMML
ncbi:BolA family transcriptional regulator [Neiella sp. HB171785]|uniref:BolA family transcriptional regulator n=1 Tax=Neiella litorisoli TaxID=2771431 RepID=A0A8J6QSG4_9GAMM|nr:BolA family protein [Neiella litorisoli]MBD1389899.1 BolA family transcriptional regulator [Neiella litorisoli]